MSSSAAEGGPETEFPDRLKARRRLLIGPTNSAGQGFQWARSISPHLKNAAGHSFRLKDDDNPFPVDFRADLATFRGDKEWANRFAAFAARNYTHVLFESNRPIFGVKKGGALLDIKAMRSAGLRVGMLAHGSDVRIPSVHAGREEWAQYQHMDPVSVKRLEANAQTTVKAFEQFVGPKFVSTLGLLDFVPDARWCPVVVDIEAWKTEFPVLESTTPVVAHIPSSEQKGSEWIDPILQGLADRGHIDYLRLSGIPRAEMPAHVRRCDILVEQFGIADYSVAACEALAAGRIVVSRVAHAVRERVLAQTGLNLPIVEADPRTLEDVILAQLDDRDQSRAIARQGAEFAKVVHDGSKSALALAELIDLPAESALKRVAMRRRMRWREAHADSLG